MVEMSVVGTWRRRGIPGSRSSHLQPHAADARAATGKMKPLGSGSVRQVTIGRCTPTPGCQPRQGRKSKVAKSDATDCLLVGSRASGGSQGRRRWAANVFHGPHVARRVAVRRAQVQRTRRARYSGVRTRQLRFHPAYGGTMAGCRVRQCAAGILAVQGGM